ncbi:MAG: tryptophan--tRNA ligase [Nitrospirota bacterium]
MRLLSGMRPTGRLHIGHLVGALGNWLSLQEEYECFFMAADWHALTTAYADTSELPKNIMEMALDWRALGIDFSRSTVFVQSDVKEHAELYLLLGMITPMPWLERDPTLKNMIEDMHLHGVNYGLMGYPVLQAADITLYKAGAVPVGVDQVPHIELAREIARAFNHRYKQVFPEPKALLTQTPKLPGTDGRKMSKSLNNAIFLDETPETMRPKVMQLITDPKKIHATDPGDPDICSVQDYHKAFGPNDAPFADEDCRKGLLGCVKHKSYLAEILSTYLAPFREKRALLAGREEETREMLKAGAETARKVAAATMEEVRDAINLSF